MSAPTVIQTATLSFGTDSYKVKSIPGDKPKTCEPVDVTCCDDSRKQFSPGALVDRARHGRGRLWPRGCLWRRAVYD